MFNPSGSFEKKRWGKLVTMSFCCVPDLQDTALWNSGVLIAYIEVFRVSGLVLVAGSRLSHRT